jgi:hypothetical protein
MKTVDVNDYDMLRTCPFCARTCLIGCENCEHFLTAFQYGVWARHICPPVFCDGFLFRRDALTAALISDGVVCRKKAGTANHPAIEAYFCSEPANAALLREKYRKVVVPGATCGDCGNETVVPGEATFYSCAVCGAPSYLPDRKTNPYN